MARGLQRCLIGIQLCQMIPTLNRGVHLTQIRPCKRGCLGQMIALIPILGSAKEQMCHLAGKRHTEAPPLCFYPI